MSTSKRPLVDIVSTGLSLVACAAGAGQAKRMREIECALSEASISCAAQRWLAPSCLIEHALRWVEGERLEDDVALVILVAVPYLSSGWQLPLDRVIWTEGRPAVTHRYYSAYAQYQARASGKAEVIHHVGRIA